MSDIADTLRPVDELEIIVLVDNVTDNLSSVPENVGHEIQTLTGLGMKTWGGDCMCCAHHGLSLVVNVRTGEERRSLLFDAGPEGYTVERNGDRLGVDFGAIDAAMLSHGHWDHGGGLIAALKLMRASGDGGKIPFFMHPDMFRRRGFQFPNGFVLPFRDVPKEVELNELGADVRCAAEPQTVLDDCYFISGEIPRITPFEAGLPNHVVQSADADDAWEPDPWIMDERYLAVNVKDKGLVIFSACSHAGIVNVLEDARSHFGDIGLHCVMGGFHLSGALIEPIIPDTVARMADFDLDVIVPAHCTGYRAVTALVNAFGDKVVPSAVGRRYRF
jgi:7,8-dihydropterin-6-yl-methyl-4-(beta-D-ribofuranosyl)aminobenzene 5'-phosphate synthase